VLLDARLSPKVPEAKWLISNGLQAKVGFEGKNSSVFTGNLATLLQ
jgi:hypothetical protein